jgi:hypothetical protein
VPQRGGRRKMEKGRAARVALPCRWQAASGGGWPSVAWDNGQSRAWRFAAGHRKVERGGVMVASGSASKLTEFSSAFEVGRMARGGQSNSTSLSNSNQVSSVFNA